MRDGDSVMKQLVVAFQRASIGPVSGNSPKVPRRMPEHQSAGRLRRNLRLRVGPVPVSPGTRETQHDEHRNVALRAREEWRVEAGVDDVD
jgi:hypothetical protein